MTTTATTPPAALRLGLVCDLLEERWASMDLVAEMVLDHLRDDWAGQVAATAIRPPMVRRATRIHAGPAAAARHNVDRLLNRFWDYPRALRRITRRAPCDLYHVIDHSYAQLVHALPAGRAVVTCHDLDAFRCLLEPRREPRPRWFRALARRILSGLQAASAVVCDSAATLRALRAQDLVPEERLHLVPIGIADAYTAEADPAADAEAAALLGGPLDPDGPPELLHVGTTIPRKRIDVLLAVFAEVRRAVPDARLVRLGGAFTAAQTAQVEALGLADAITVLPFCARPVVAAVYRRAALVLQPSDAEGFGLPVAEALACGTPVLASDLEVLREVGGDAAAYAPVGDVPAWSSSVLALLAERRGVPDAWRVRRDAGLAQASTFRWSAHVARLVEIYRGVLGGPGEAP